MVMPQHQEHSPISIPWDGLTGWNGHLTTMVGHAVQACMAACAEWQQEATRFTRERFDEDRRAQEAFASSRNISDLAKVQQEWRTKATHAYFDEAMRLTQMATKLAQAGMTSYQAAETGIEKSKPRLPSESIAGQLLPDGPNRWRGSGSRGE
jgi:hypothetical protein